MTIKIIFLCPHNAAKSVAAAAFLADQAAKQGLDVDITTAGTEPDSAVLPIVRSRLEALGLSFDGPPRRVTEKDLSAVDLIVNMGCNHNDLPTSGPIRDWRIPNFSDDADAAFAAIEARVRDLADSLMAVR